MVSSTPPVFYFQLPAYPRTGSSLKRFGCCCLYLKLPDYFTILTFSPSSFCETSSFALTVGLRLVPGLIWHLLTSKGYHDVIPCSNICFHFDIRSYLCRIILRSLRVRLTAFHSCSLYIYLIVFCAVSGFCLLCNITHTTLPYMQFLFVGSNVCRQLPSDSPSRWTPLLLANTKYCNSCSGLAPYSL